jgi:hypothetical protein
MIKQESGDEKGEEKMKTSRHCISLLSITIILAVMIFTCNEGQAKEFPIAATAQGEFGFSAAFDGTNYLVGIQGDALSTANITAQLISQSGTRIGPRINIGRTGGVPQVAFDGVNYLMIWRNDRNCDGGDCGDIYGQFISTSGTPVDSPFLINEQGDQELGISGIIFDGANYFVVWESRSNPSDPNSGDRADIYGQFVTPEGALLGPALPVSVEPHGQRMPSLAFDGANILVVWADGRNQSACYSDGSISCCYESDIYGQFVTKSSAGGAGSLYEDNFAISLSDLPCDNPPFVAFDGTNYLVAFQEETTLPACPETDCPGCKWDLFGQFISTAGDPVGTKITISNTAPNHLFPMAVYDGTGYLITWTEGLGDTPADASIKGSFFDTSGNPAGPEFTLFFPAGKRVALFAASIFNGSEHLSVVTRCRPGSDPYNLDTYTQCNVYGAFFDAHIFVAPKSVKFGNVKLEGTSAKTITIENTAAADLADLVISDISITGTNASEFDQTNDCTTIPTGASCAITVTFNPTLLPFGKKTATISISSNDPKKPVVDVKLTGSAPPPKISTTPSSVKFGNLAVGDTSAPKTVTIKNTGTSDLVISDINITGTNASEFGQTNNCTTIPIPAGASCTVTVTFAPISVGKKSAIIAISSNDPKKPTINVKLSGNGNS